MHALNYRIYPQTDMNKVLQTIFVVVSTTVAVSRPHDDAQAAGPTGSQG